MSKKCCYRGCESTSYSIPSVTFFGFPKETDSRYESWMKLTKCDPSIKNKLICSNHFDQKKYMSMNQRRKMLLSTAMPFECLEDESGLEIQDQNFKVILSNDDDNEEVSILVARNDSSDEGKNTFIISFFK